MNIEEIKKEFEELVENRTLVNVGVGEDGTLRKQLCGEWWNFIEQSITKSNEEAYKRGFGEGISASVELTDQIRKDLTQKESE